MKITKVDVMMLHTKRKGGVTGWRPVVCRIFTDEGIYGDGEAALAYGTAAPAAMGMIQDLAKLIIGMDPLDNEVIWNKMYKRTFWAQNGGPIIFSGMSAIDIALWDIKGKFFGLPVYKLLGGKMRDNLRCYASQLQFGWGEENSQALTKPEQYYEVAKKAVAEGYDCVKVDFLSFDRDGRVLTAEDCTRLLSPYYVGLAEERIAATRDAVGTNVDIIMENHSRLDAASAVQLGRMAEKYNIFFYEEPNTPSPKTARFIKEGMRIPLAHGERIYTRWQYAPYFEDGSLTVIQPDLGNTGGITEGKKICDMAYTYDIGVQTHVCASPLSLAASLHLECAIPNFVIHEHHRCFLTNYNKELCLFDYQPVNGKFQIPERPGLGNEWAEYALTNCDKLTVE